MSCGGIRAWWRTRQRRKFIRQAVARALDPVAFHNRAVQCVETAGAEVQQSPGPVGDSHPAFSTGPCRLEAPFTAIFRNGTVEGATRLPRLHENEWLAGHEGGRIPDIENAAGVVFDARARGEESNHLQRALILGGNATNNYFHWVTEALLKLEAAATTNLPMVVIRPDAPSFVAKSLELWGVPSGNIFKTAACLSIDEMWIPSHPRSEGRTHQDLLHRMTKRLRGRAGVTEGTRRLYVSRSGASVRHVQNEDEVRTILEPLGFEWVFPATLSFSEQVRLFGSAAWIAGPHGAGLTNLVFARNPRVLEIHGDNGVNPCYFHLTSAAAGTYGSVLAREQNGSLVVNPRRIVEVIREMEKTS